MLMMVFVYIAGFNLLNTLEI